MTLRIEDYALIGDCKTAALVGRDGSIDWLCWPRFDSAACFAALLGTAENGRWLIAPKHPVLGVSRRYRPGTLVLETEFQTENGSAIIVDFMPPGDGTNLVRIAVGRSGRVEFRTDFVVRFNYGRQCHGLADSMTGRSTRLPAPSGWSCEHPLPFTART
jgi:GH15 family glucan-1,4-alpha-glucosidase